MTSHKGPHGRARAQPWGTNLVAKAKPCSSSSNVSMHAQGHHTAGEDTRAYVVDAGVSDVVCSTG